MLSTRLTFLEPINFVHNYLGNYRKVASSNTSRLEAHDCFFRLLIKEITILGLEAPSVVDDVLQPGRKLVAAGYALYGSATMMVLSTGQGVNGFIYDPSIGEFVLTKPNIVMKPAGRQYSVNESYSASWDRRILDFINSKKQGNNPIPQR